MLQTNIEEGKANFYKVKVEGEKEQERRKSLQKELAELKAGQEEEKKAAVRLGRMEARKAVYTSRRYLRKMYEICEDIYRKALLDAQQINPELKTDGLHPLLGKATAEQIQSVPFSFDQPIRTDSDHEGESEEEEAEEEDDEEAPADEEVDANDNLQALVSSHPPPTEDEVLPKTP